MANKVTYRCKCGHVMEYAEGAVDSRVGWVECDQCKLRAYRVPVEFIDGIEKMNVNIPYDEHNPSRNPLNLIPRPGHILIVRHPFPEEKTRAGVVIPATRLDRHGKPILEYPTNCGRVIASTEDCWVQPGEYAFWAQRVPVSEEYYRKPQPVIGYYDPEDRFPTLWTMNDEYVTCKVCHAGDPEWLTIGGDDEVTVLGMTGKLYPVPHVEQLKVGEVFCVNGGEYRTSFGVESEDEEKGTTRVFAAPYDGQAFENRV